MLKEISLDNAINEYIITLDEIELLVLSVAKKQLESSFEIHKSIGFIQFLNDNSYIINK